MTMENLVVTVWASPSLINLHTESIIRNSSSVTKPVFSATDINSGKLAFKDSNSFNVRKASADAIL